MGGACKAFSESGVWQERRMMSALGYGVLYKLFIEWPGAMGLCASRICEFCCPRREVSVTKPENLGAAREFWVLPENPVLPLREPNKDVQLKTRRSWR